MSDAERYYDEVLAPRLLELAEDAAKHGLPCLCVVELSPDRHGRTQCAADRQPGLPFQLIAWAAQTMGNVDALWMAVQRHARAHGHSSIFLAEQGIPPTAKAVKYEPTNPEDCR